MIDDYIDLFVCFTASGACIPDSALCNGEFDCGPSDFSDEELCNIDECKQSSEPLCAHICEDRKHGYECLCHPGYRVSHKQRNLCEDINECNDPGMNVFFKLPFHCFVSIKLKYSINTFD